jgi:hypothetical protein
VANPDPSALSWVSSSLYGRVRPLPLGPNPGARSGAWRLVSGLLDGDGGLDALVDARSRPLGARPDDQGDRGLVVQQVVREATSVLAGAAVGLWSQRRRLLDWSAANVALTPGPMGVDVGLVDASLTVLDHDPLVGAEHVTVVDEHAMLEALLDVGLGRAVPAGERPGGAEGGHASAIGVLVAECRRMVRTGDRHLWGNVALAAANALVHAPEADRDLVFGGRPDLLATIELVDGAGCTFALRRTCCLLYKLPAGQLCSTCSLGDREEQRVVVGRFYQRDS